MRPIMKHNVIVDTEARDLLHQHIQFATQVSRKYAVSIYNDYIEKNNVFIDYIFDTRMNNERYF